MSLSCSISLTSCVGARRRVASSFPEIWNEKRLSRNCRRPCAGWENPADEKTGQDRLKDALVNARRRLGRNGPGLVHVHMKHPRSRDRAVIVQQKHQAHSTPDKAQLQRAFLVHRAVQLRRHGNGTVVRMARNADRAPAEAFDPVMPALGLHVDQGTARQARAIYNFSRCHMRAFNYHDAISSPLVATLFSEWDRERLWNSGFPWKQRGMEACFP